MDLRNQHSAKLVALVLLVGGAIWILSGRTWSTKPALATFNSEGIAPGASVPARGQSPKTQALDSVTSEEASGSSRGAAAPLEMRKDVTGHGTDYDPALLEALPAAVTITALEVGTEDPVEGVSVEILVEGKPRNAPIARGVTDTAGTGTAEIDEEASTPYPMYRVRAEHPDMLALGYPTHLETIPETLEIRVARTLRFEGRVIDPHGAPLPDAVVALGQETESWELSAMQLAVTDETGEFSSEYVRNLAAKPHLFAFHQDYPPTYVEIDLDELKGSGSASAVLQFSEGVDVVLKIRDSEGQPVPECRVGLVTARHPLIDHGTTYFGSPPFRAGVKSLRGVTDGDGLFESSGWPMGQEVRAVVYDEYGESRSITSIAPGRIDQGVDAIATIEGARASIVLTILRTPNVAIECDGTAVGFSPDDRRALRIALQDERGVTWGGTIEWDGEDSFHVTFMVEGAQMRSDARYTIVDRSGDSDVRFGPYSAVGPTHLGTIALSR